MESLGFNLPLLLKTIDDILVTPADFMRQTLVKDQDQLHRH